VSLVDKEKMRAKQANILEILKVWLKASAAERAAQATEGAKLLATAALADNEVSGILSVLYVLFIRDVLELLILCRELRMSHRSYVTNFRCAFYSFQLIVVKLMEFGSDGKVAKVVQDTCKSVHPAGSFFIASLDDESEK
jgi:hypothetical protein